MNCVFNLMLYLEHIFNCTNRTTLKIISRLKLNRKNSRINSCCSIFIVHCITNSMLTKIELYVLFKEHYINCVMILMIQTIYIVLYHINSMRCFIRNMYLIFSCRQTLNHILNHQYQNCNPYYLDQFICCFFSNSDLLFSYQIYL